MYYWNMGISDKKGSIKGKGMRTGKVAKWEVDTIKGHMKRLKHNHLSLLKIDVEGFEWVVLREVSCRCVARSFLLFRCFDPNLFLSSKGSRLGCHGRRGTIGF